MSAPQNILSDQLSEVLGNRKVNTAVFTTFNYDPGFFELHILPLIFPSQKFSEVEKVRLIQLEDCLRSIRNLAVYFDTNALAHDGQSPKLGYNRVAVKWKRGVFHPKTVFLLAEDAENTQRETLIVCCQSANITRAGWWENIECAHIEVVEDRRIAEHPCSFRSDLMALLSRIQRQIPKEDHTALDAVYQFVKNRTESRGDIERDRDFEKPVRLFGGKQRLGFSAWLEEEARIPQDWNLEVISPYFDKANANTLVHLLDATKPRQTRVFLPQHEDGTALVSEAVYNEVESLPRVEWAKFSDGITQRKGATTVEKLAPRFVHAKVYRYWKKRQHDLIVVGSINCTQPAHSTADQGNLEAGLFIQASDQKSSRDWWLEQLEDESMRFVSETLDESDGNDQALFDVSVKYDWARHEVAVRLEGDLVFPIKFSDMTESLLFSIEEFDALEWQICDRSAADRMREAIRVSSFLNVQCEDVSWRTLVREESFSHRPSLLTELTPDEILKYWSLLSTEQRTAFLERHVVESVEGLATRNSPLIDTEESVFHQFSSIFHAFGHLRRHLIESLDDERFLEAEYRLFGAKYDSLPELLRKLIEHEDKDPLYVYITCLSAKQLRNELEKKYRSFLADRNEMLSRLDHLIDDGLKCREEIYLGGEIEAEDFLEWYESMFLKKFNP